MKTLVIVTHPNLEASRVNKAWVQRLAKEKDITVHDLYTHYPDKQIHPSVEQELLITHDRIVFQFPFYWYNMPAFLKQWQEQVLEYGWITGAGGRSLHGKDLVLAISVGAEEKAYQAGGFNSYTISEFTKPMQAIANLIGMHFLPPYVLYGAAEATDDRILQSAEEYVQHILDPNLNPRLVLKRSLEETKMKA